MITEAIIVAIIGGAFTLAGVMISNNSTKAVMEEKINDLTTKVEKHNNLVERIYKMEVEVDNIREDLKELNKAS